jgi:ATP-dependent exoDNAse (exonuclease V) beta subunit
MPGEEARRVGLIAHAALEARNLGDDDALLQAARTAGRILDSERPSGGATVQGDDACAAAAEILRGFLQSGLRARLAPAGVLGREVPILHRDAAGTTWTGACDLILRERGVVVVVDYKTDRLPSGVEAATAAAEAYRAQLEVYRGAVQAAMPGETVTSEVWFLRTGVAVRL